MNTSDLTSSMQEMMTEMAAMRAEFNNLKERAQALPQPSQPATNPTSITNTRRTTLKRLGLALLGGAAAATALGQSPVQARVIANPQINGLTNKAGMLVVPPGTTVPLSGAAPAYTYGLLASGDTTPLDLNSLPQGSTGIYGSSGFNGVCGNGSVYGVYGNGATGVWGNGSFTGVKATGTGSGSFGIFTYADDSNTTGIYARGTQYGVNASGNGVGSYGVTANGDTYGVKGTGTTGVKGTGTGIGSTGVNGAGSEYGVSGTGTGIGSTGVNGAGTLYGVSGSGPTGVWGTGTQYGVYGEGTGIGVGAISIKGGVNFPALRADNPVSNGIAAIFANNSNDTTLLITNTGTGPLIKGWAANAVPKFQVDNNGTVHTAGTYQVGGMDLAEVIPVTEKLEPGDVVEIDLETAGYFKKCRTAGCLAVAGVISTRPGVSLGITHPSDVEDSGQQLALAGRIPVKVTTEGGPIKPGDLLVASATPGHAMRAHYPAEQGSVVGKALGRLESGTGTVEMLVMLR